MCVTQNTETGDSPFFRNLPLDGEMVQCKRTGLRSQFRAGVGPLLPLESERCPAFLRPGLMVLANALHYALRIRTLLCMSRRRRVEKTGRREALGLAKRRLVPRGVGFISRLFD